MIKSIQDIEKDFLEKHPSKPPASDSKKHQDEESKNKKASLIADIIFGIALIGSGLSAMIISWGEKGSSQGIAYEILGNYRGMVLLMFLGLVVVSFALRFIGGKKE